jgi:hypothetical protein
MSPLNKKTLRVSSAFSSQLWLSMIDFTCSSRGALRRLEFQGSLAGFSRNPPFGPTGYLAECALKLPAFLGQLVVDSHRAFGNYGSKDQALRLQGAKSLRQHSISDVRNCRLNRSVAGLSLKQRLQDSASPTATDELDSAVETTANWGNGRFGHVTKFTDRGA